MRDKKAPGPPEFFNATEQRRVLHTFFAKLFAPGQVTKIEGMFFAFGNTHLLHYKHSNQFHSLPHTSSRVDSGAITVKKRV